MKVTVLPWSEFDRWMRELCAKKGLGNIKFVYGPPRGGLIPAVALSHRLGATLLTDIAYVEDQLLLGTDPSQILIVDEIVDSGKTLREIREQLHDKVRYAAWIVKEQVVEEFPDLILHAVWPKEDDSWLVFPWEDPLTAVKEKEAYDASRE